MSADLKRKNEDSKRSVFDRLGPDSKSSAPSNSAVNSKTSTKMPSSCICPSFAKTGYCQLGSKCKYDHPKKGKEKDESKNKPSKKEKEYRDVNKELETKLKSTVVSKSSEDSTDHKRGKLMDAPSKSSRSGGRSPSPGAKKKRSDEQTSKQRDKRTSNESAREDQRHEKQRTVDEKSDRHSSKVRRSDPPPLMKTSTTGSKKTVESLMSLPSPTPRELKSFEAERCSGADASQKSRSRKDAEVRSKTTSKNKMESSRKVVVEKREVVVRKGDEGRDRRDAKDSGRSAAAASASVLTAAAASERNAKSSEKMRDVQRPKGATRTKGRQRSVSESSSSSSSSGSSSSSSGSSSDSSSQSSYYSSPSMERQKKKGGEVKKNRKAALKQSDTKAEKPTGKRLEKDAKATSVVRNKRKHSREEYSEERSLGHGGDRVKRSKQKPDASRGGKRDHSASLSPTDGAREGRYFGAPGGNAEEGRRVRLKASDPTSYEQRERIGLDRSHEDRRVKVDPYVDKISPGVELRRKDQEYFRDDSYGYRRTREDYGSLERKESRERPHYEIPAKDAIYSDGPVRRERLSRRDQWEDLEADGRARSKHKHHLSEEGYSPSRKKRSSPRVEYRDRADKVYDADRRKRDYDGDDDSLIDDPTFEPRRQRRSSRESWHRYGEEEGRSRRDQPEREKSRGRSDYMARSPVGSSECSPRRRPNRSKRVGDYSSYDYDVERSGRSLSRSSMGSKPSDHPRYYDGKRSLGGSSSGAIPPQYLPPYDYRDYHATPEVDILEGSRGFVGKPVYWDEYKRTDGPQGGSSYRAAPTHLRPTYSHPSTSGPPSDWESGRVSGRQQSHDWENRYERSSEEFRGRRDVLLPPPPRPRHETSNSDTASPAATNVPDHNPVEGAPEAIAPKSVKFELDGYEEVSEEELDEDAAAEDREGAEGAGGGACEEEEEEDEEVESLPKKIPLVDMLDIEWQSLVKLDEELSKKWRPSSCTSQQKVSDVFREIGLSREFAGEELFEKINSMLAAEESEGGGVDDDVDAKRARPVSSNGTVENGGASQIAPVQSCQEMPENEGESEVKEEESKGRLSNGGTEGKENRAENFEVVAVEKKTKKGFLLHDVANFHVTAFLKMKRRQSVVGDIGPYRKGLCARRDLAIRRVLCRVERDDIVMFPAQLADQELYKLSLQLFKQSNKISQENSAPFSLA